VVPVPLQKILNIAAEFFETRCADGDPEIAAGNVFQFVRLVEDHDPCVGKDACVGGAFGLLFDSEIGKEQVMIDDHDVAFRGATPHLGNEALVP
jgi:hypothetical protein